jgi:hypothetical protein
MLIAIVSTQSTVVKGICQRVGTESVAQFEMQIKESLPTFLP